MDFFDDIRAADAAEHPNSSGLNAGELLFDRQEQTRLHLRSVLSDDFALTGILSAERQNKSKGMSSDREESESKKEDQRENNSEKQDPELKEKIEEFLSVARKLDNELQAHEVDKIATDLASQLAKIHKKFGEDGVRGALRVLRDKDTYYDVSPYTFSSKDVRRLALDISKGDKLLHRKFFFSTEPEKDQSELAKAAANAITAGDLKQLTGLSTRVMELVDADRYEFEMFNIKLLETLEKDEKNKGFTIRFGSGKGGASTEFSVHREGKSIGVHIAVKREPDGKIKTTVQAYDWVTKEDVQRDAKEVLADFTKASDERLKDGVELGKAFDKAFNASKYEQFYTDMASSVQHALKQGGMEAVRKLEKSIDKNTETRNHSPAIFEDNGVLKLCAVQSIDKEKGEAMTAAQRKKQNVVEHPRYGFVKIIDESSLTIRAKK